MKTLFEKKGYDPVNPSALERLQRGAGPKGRSYLSNPSCHPGLLVCTRCHQQAHEGCTPAHPEALVILLTGMASAGIAYCLKADPPCR